MCEFVCRIVFCLNVFIYCCIQQHFIDLQSYVSVLGKLYCYNCVSYHRAYVCLATLQYTDNQISYHNTMVKTLHRHYSIFSVIFYEHVKLNFILVVRGRHINIYVPAEWTYPFILNTPMGFLPHSEQTHCFKYIPVYS